MTVRVSLPVPTSAPGAQQARPPPPLRQTTGDARWLLLVADDQGRLQHVRRFAAAQLAQSGQLAFAMPMSAGHASAHLLHPEHLGLDGAIGFTVSGGAPPPSTPPPAAAPPPPAVDNAVEPSPSPYQRPPPTTSPAPAATSKFGVAAARAAAARTAALDPTAASRPAAPPAGELNILEAMVQSDDDDDMYSGLTDRAVVGAGQAEDAGEVWLDAEEAALFGEGPLFVEGAPALTLTLTLILTLTLTLP